MITHFQKAMGYCSTAVLYPNINNCKIIEMLQIPMSTHKSSLRDHTAKNIPYERSQRSSDRS
jgi:hypothetical protein